MSGSIFLQSSNETNILQLEMRPSTSTIDAHNRSCNVKIVVSYDKNRNLVLSFGENDDLRSHFI